jgi:hypothetical protein
VELTNGVQQETVKSTSGGIGVKIKLQYHEGCRGVFWFASHCRDLQQQIVPPGLFEESCRVCGTEKGRYYKRFEAVNYGSRGSRITAGPDGNVAESIVDTVHLVGSRSRVGTMRTEWDNRRYGRKLAFEELFPNVSQLDVGHESIGEPI